MTQQPTMRALLQREIAQQERFIKEKLTSLLVPFKKSLHFRVTKAYTTFSVKLKKPLSIKELLRIEQAFPPDYMVLSNSFLGEMTQHQFIEIRMPNQSSHFFHLRELLSYFCFRKTKGILPIVLGLDDRDLYAIDLATSKHIAIESDLPSYRYKLQQLFLHSLLTPNNHKRVQIAWIEEPLEHTKLCSRIAPFMLTEANQAEEVLPLIVAENEKRKAENAFETRWIIFVSDAYASYHQHKDLFNALEDSQAQGIHLIGTSECLDKDTMTVKDIMEYNSLFNPSLWMDTEGRLHHERSIIQLPFFTEKTVIPFEFYQLLDKRINEILGRTEIDLLGKSMDFQQVQRTLSPEINRYHLRSSDGRITLSLSAIRSTLDHMHQKLFYDMIERLSKNIYYFVGETSEKLTHLKELRIEPESGQVLINDKVAYTSTSEGGLVPLIVQSIYDLTLHAVSQTVTTLDQLDEATYPQLHLVTEALQRGEAYKEIAPQTTPIALISEIEDILSKVEFQLASKKEVGEDTSPTHKNKHILEGIDELPNKDFAFKLLEFMRDYGLLENNLITLTDVQACKNLGHTFPILLEADGENNSKDNSGRDRYYPNDLFTYNGKEYYVTNDWYEKTKEKSSNRDNRPLFLSWVNSLLNE
ncbi:hypothetical protein [Capnocytophaga granulosa]